MPTSFSPFSVKATMEGVVRAPSAFSITLAVLPSITATHELVVPRSMPITSLPAPAANARAPMAAACCRTVCGARYAHSASMRQRCVWSFTQ